MIASLGRIALLGAAFAFGTALAMAEVKETDPGASCTNSTETIQGQTASCKSCSATKCDTSGNTVTNCRVETTKTCTIGGRVVSGGTVKGPKLDKVPDAMLDSSSSSGGKGVKGVKGTVGGMKNTTSP